MRSWVSLILVAASVAVGMAQCADADLSKEPLLQQPLTLKYPVISLHELYRMAQEQPVNEADSESQEPTLPPELTTVQIQIRAFEGKQTTVYRFYEGELHAIPARRGQYVVFILTARGGKELLRVPVLLRYNQSQNLHERK